MVWNFEKRGESSLCCLLFSKAICVCADLIFWYETDPKVTVPGGKSRFAVVSRHGGARMVIVVKQYRLTK